MSKRNPVSTIKPIWTDAQEVSDTDLKSEQNYNDTIQSSNIFNHIGTGILPETLKYETLFSSELASGYLDGKPIFAQKQPSDNTLGNQIQVILSNSKAVGNRKVKVAIIGLDFNGELQHETFCFSCNEIQVSKRHYTNILLILTNDLQGNPNLSLNLGGNLEIKEAPPLYLSKNLLSVAQDIEPNLFFRDFFLDGFLSLQSLLQSALPYYDVNSLNIFTGEKNTYSLVKNDVITQIGQKFLTQSNNIQKITMLLSVQNTDLGNEDDLQWNGELVASLYQLQSSLNCINDITPNLDIEFPPTNVPVSQISFNYNSLLNEGIELGSVPQPVDFLFSNTPISNRDGITKNSYYVISLKRSGSANKCDILISAGSNRLENARATTFTGNLWVDLPEEDLWFQVWSDSAKISDGQAYENGHGIAIPKTNKNELGFLTDYSYQDADFDGNDIYHGVISSNVSETEYVADQRTGDPVATRTGNLVNFQLFNSLGLNNLKSLGNPLIAGSIADKNIKFIDSNNLSISANLYSATFVNNNLLIKIVDDLTDGYRYDSDVNQLASSLLNGYLIGGKLIPNPSNPSQFYRISEAYLSSMMVGDINGDGIVDENDLLLFNKYKDFNLNVSAQQNSAITTDGYTTTFTNGYNTLSKKFVSESSLNFQIVNQAGVVSASSNDGYLLFDNLNNEFASFSSGSINFSLVSDLTNCKLVLLNPTNSENKGAFSIVNKQGNTLKISKIYLDDNSIAEILRADIDGDFHISSNDGYLLQNYINKNIINSGFLPPFPGPSTNGYEKIGTKFNVIKLKLEKYIDRKDDYASLLNNRANTIHQIPDLFSDVALQNRNFYSNPLELTIQRQLVWKDNLVVVNSNTKYVASTFENTSLGNYSCNLQGVIDTTYQELDKENIPANDYFFPGNIILSKNSQLTTEDNEYYKVDFEVGTIVLEVPDGLYGTEQTINLFDSFIYDYTGDGLTRLGFPAMKFADCSKVGVDALSLNQIRFSVSVQSFSPNINGITSELLEGIIVDGKIGVSINYETGLLSLNFTNLYEDSVLKTLNTKVQVQVYLKKAGFNNDPLFVASEKIQNILNVSSNYSGSGINNLITHNGGGFTPAGDLAPNGSLQKVVGIQGNPISSTAPTLNQILQWNGSAWVPATIATGGFTAAGDLSGTSSSQTVVGIRSVPVSNTAPTNGQVLSYNGTQWAPAAPAGGSITNVQDGANYSNTLNVVGFTNNSSTSNNTYVAGATLEFDRSLLKGAGPGTRVINLKVIAETTSPQMSIRLFNITTSSVVSGSTLTTSSTTPVVLTSGDLTSALSAGSAIYQIQIKMDTGANPDRVALDYAGLKIVWS